MRAIGAKLAAMRFLPLAIAVVTSLALITASAPSFANAGTKAQAQTKGAKKGPAPAKPKEDGKVGYGDVQIELSGMMVPYHTPSGTTYEPVTIRLQVAPGVTERPACLMVPIVHDKLLMYLHAAHLAQADFTGERRDVITKSLLDVAVKATDRGYYTGVSLVVPGDEPQPLNDRSTTLSKQCH